MKKHLLLVGLLLAALFQVVAIENNVQLYCFALILLVTGVPHGSLDYFVEKETLKRSLKGISLRSFLLKYLTNMALYALVWIFFPIAALILFILLTAFHFGEIDWPVRKNTTTDAVLYSLYGLQIIVFIITSHIKEAAPILELATQRRISSDVWLHWGNIAFNYCSVSIVCFLMLMVAFKKYIDWHQTIVVQFVSQTLLLTSIIFLLPLYLSFGFYFGVWHSLLSFNLIRRQMNLPASFEGWVHLIRKAIPFTLLAWFGLIGMTLFSITTNTQLIVLTNLFIGIAILTLPHLQVFTKIKLP